MFKFFWILYNKFSSFFRFLTLASFFNILNYFYSIFLESRFLVFYKDLNSFFFNKITYVWLLITKHRLFYIVRLLFIVFLLYKPILIDLDSIYWLGTTVFYFFSNTFFFLSSITIPGFTGFKTWWFYKIFIVVSFFPAFWSARKFKKRLLKRRRFLLGDDDIVFVFKWVQQLFVYTFYYLLLSFLFIFSSFLIPIVYVYLTEVNFVFVTELLFVLYFSPFNFLLLPFSYLMSFTYFFVLPFFSKFLFFVVYFLFNYLTVVLFSFFKILYFYLITFLFIPFLFLFSFFYTYLNGAYEVVFSFLSVLFVLFNKVTDADFIGIKSLNNMIDVYKTFLFSDNYLNLILLVLINFFKVTGSFVLSLLGFFLSNFGFFIRLILGVSLFDIVVFNLNVVWSYVIIIIYDKLILVLEWSGTFYNLYFSKVSVFGFFSTWYEYLNHNVQKGDSRNSLINWLLLHIYLSIIVFWFLDFDFRVSAKSPPKTPYTLLEEAKKTYDWVPADMDFGSMQTDHTAVYFALLDISFEHVESLNFVYGDFEYIDEEYDHEDDTPDEDEMFNDVQETTTVREIIDTDIYFGRKVYPSSIYFNPLNAKTSYERHYLTEIVGEPELTYIEPELKWMYESIYTPSFEELHFKDSLFSEWVFDPDEDLTLFEVLIFFPLFFYFIYVWFYHRRRRKHYKAWLRYMIPTRRTAYSGSYVEDLLGVSLGDFGRRIFNTMRKYKSPEFRVKNFYRLKLQRNNQRLKLLQVESFFFEKLRHKAYKKALKEWEKGLNIGVEFLVPRKRLPQFYTGIKNLKIEMKTWARFGDWTKFDRFSGEYKYKGGFQRYEHYQYDLPALLDKYMMKVARIRKRKRYLWRTINKLPGHNLMARKSKFWHSRFGNTELFFPTHRMKYNYNYYNYIGWRENRTQWRRYAFTPGNVTNKIWALNRDVPEGGYRSFRGHQKKRRLMKSFQF